jgi:hypothetical protein
LVLADTAGRLHNKVNLIEELKKIRRVAGRPPGHVTEVLLVLDATTGQNGLAQAKVFLDAVDVTGVVLTKLDGTAKGGSWWPSSVSWVCRSSWSAWARARTTWSTSTPPPSWTRCSDARVGHGSKPRPVA